MFFLEKDEDVLDSLFSEQRDIDRETDRETDKHNLFSPTKTISQPPLLNPPLSPPTFSLTTITHIIHILISNHMTLSEVIPPQRSHARPIPTQRLTDPLRHLPPFQPRTLPAHRAQTPFLAIKANKIRTRHAPLTPEIIVAMRLEAQLVTTVRVPRPAEVGDPMDGIRSTQPGDEAGAGGVLVEAAEMVEDVGGVLVEVVVFELEVVGFAGLLGGGGGLGAEAVGADEVVAGVGGEFAAGETWYLADLDLGGSGGVDGCEIGCEGHEDRGDGPD